MSNCQYATAIGKPVVFQTDEAGKVSCVFCHVASHAPVDAVTVTKTVRK